MWKAFAAAIVAVAIAAPAAQAGLGGKPTASFTYSPSNPKAGQTITFTSTAHNEGSFFCDFDPAIVEWRWDFNGDHVWDAYGPTATWTYALPGPAVVTHDVTDDCRHGAQGQTGSQTSLLLIQPAI